MVVLEELPFSLSRFMQTGLSHARLVLKGLPTSILLLPLQPIVLRTFSKKNLSVDNLNVFFRCGSTEIVCIQWCTVVLLSLLLQPKHANSYWVQPSLGLPCRPRLTTSAARSQEPYVSKVA